MLMQVGRRILLLTGSTLGLLADFTVAIVFNVTYSGGANLPPSASIASIVLVQIAPCWSHNCCYLPYQVIHQATGACFSMILRY